MNWLCMDVQKRHSSPDYCSKHRSAQNFSNFRALRSSRMWSSNFCGLDCHFGQHKFKSLLNLVQGGEITTRPGFSVFKYEITVLWCLTSKRSHPNSRSKACPARNPKWSVLGPNLLGLHTSATVFNCFGCSKYISDKCFIPGCLFWSMVRITLHVVCNWRSSSFSEVSQNNLWISNQQ